MGFPQHHDKYPEDAYHPDPATLSSMDINQVVSELKAEVNRIENAIAALLGLSGSPRRGRPPKSSPRSRTMLPEARKRIGAAKKAWWAKQKGKSAPKKAAAAPAKRAAVRRTMSPAMKKKMSALMKARWVARKKAGAKTL